MVRKLSNAFCAEFKSSDWSADPIFNSENEKVGLLDASDVSLVVKPEVVFNRLVSESYADCAEVVSPELIALKRLSTSLSSSLMSELTLPVSEESADKEVDEVLGRA